MRLLLIHTCGAEGFVALAEDAVVEAVELLPGRSSSETLLPAVQRLMEPRDWRVRDLAAVAVVVGPGSFTGVRVGLSAAKGLCEAGGVGMLAMSRLALVAAAIEAEVEGEVLAVLDAGRGEYFCGVYRDGGRIVEQLLRMEEVRTLMQDRRVVTCEARVAESLAKSIGGSVDLVAEPGPGSILAMALNRIQTGQWSDVASVDANYLRRTDAEILVHGR
jgi:tRNA threonylcarbamoyladenosine biosynthesis protein TsaB